jgi:hypothetical protein
VPENVNRKKQRKYHEQYYETLCSNRWDRFGAHDANIHGSRRLIRTINRRVVAMGTLDSDARKPLRLIQLGKMPS